MTCHPPPLSESHPGTASPARSNSIPPSQEFSLSAPQCLHLRHKPVLLLLLSWDAPTEVRQQRALTGGSTPQPRDQEPSVGVHYEPQRQGNSAAAEALALGPPGQAVGHQHFLGAICRACAGGCSQDNSSTFIFSSPVGTDQAPGHGQANEAVSDGWCLLKQAQLARELLCSCCSLHPAQGRGVRSSWNAAPVILRGSCWGTACPNPLQAPEKSSARFGSWLGRWRDCISKAE